MKYVTIGRHAFTPVQIELLKKVGLTEEAARFQQVQDAGEVVKKAKELGAAIVVQALPMHLLAQLLTAASRAGVSVYGFRIEALALVRPEEPCPAEADIESVDSRSGSKRCSRTVALQRLKRVIIEAEDVTTV